MTPEQKRSRFPWGNEAHRMGVARHETAEAGNAVGITADDLSVDHAWRQAAQRRFDYGEAARLPDFLSMVAPRHAR